MSLATLQELVEDLAEQLNSPAVIEDDELRMVAYSPHSMLIDDIRRDSILIKHAPAAVSDWLGRFGLKAAAGPVRIPGDEARGILGRLCVPVSYRGARLGYLWLIDDDGRLGSTQVRTAARAADQAGLLMFGDMLGERMASGVLAHLLSPMDELRADAMRHIDDSGLLGLCGPVIATLETYLDLAGDAKASAERLSLHRGTLYYRLQKAERIAGVDLRSGCDRLALHLGFKLARLIGLYPKQVPGTATGP
jgi:hypothetical protein